ATFSPDGRTILTASQLDPGRTLAAGNNLAILWDLHGNRLSEIQTLNPNAVVFSHDSKYIFTAEGKRYWTPDAINEWLQDAPVYNFSPEERAGLGID
ncbi:MAG: hypothetical protein KDG51_02125, partial [Calditrichaeota bacterium]|nr:hypothetical protein [Calditrichota bacterium]